MAVTDRARIQAGRFRHRVTLQQPVASGSTRTWTNLITVWASIQPRSGFERPEGSLSAPNETMIEVHMRWLPNTPVKPRMRLLIISPTGNRVLEISDVLNIGELNRLLVLQCREVTT